MPILCCTITPVFVEASIFAPFSNSSCSRYPFPAAQTKALSTRALEKISNLILPLTDHLCCHPNFVEILAKPLLGFLLCIYADGEGGNRA